MAASKQPLPHHAKKVFQGVIFSAYQWEQELFDGTSAIFEKIARPDSAMVLPVFEGKIVVCKQEQPGHEPFIGALGGRVEEGETAEHAAKRELLEEAGMEADNLQLWTSVQPFSSIEWTDNTFIARHVRKVAEPTPDAGEKIELCYLSFEEFIETASQESFRDAQIRIKILEARLNPSTLEALKSLFL